MAISHNVLSHITGSFFRVFFSKIGFDGMEFSDMWLRGMVNLLEQQTLWQKVNRKLFNPSQVCDAV